MRLCLISIEQRLLGAKVPVDCLAEAMQLNPQYLRRKVEERPDLLTILQHRQAEEVAFSVTMIVDN